LVDHFQIYEHDPLTKRIELRLDSLSKHLRQVDIPLKRSGYFVVSAVTKSAMTANSLPYYVHVPDSLPPIAPVFLEGRIDFSGRVYLYWKHADESDVFGYHVYRSSDTSDFICVSAQILNEPTYIDSIALNTEDANIYYRVVAIDRSFNPSPYSPILILKRPDIVSPTPPTFSAVNYDSLGATLKWYRSASNDVANYVMYSRVDGDSIWKQHGELRHTDSSYFFNNRIGSHKLSFTLVTRDDAGLESDPATPVTVHCVVKRPVAVTEMFSVLDSREKKIGLFWEYPPAAPVDFLLYKSINGSQAQLFRRLSSADRTFQDQFDRNDRLITYAFAVVDVKSGQRSKLSTPIIIEP
jgi:uncharacterized protein